MSACESCGDTETLLFTCQYCGEQFCLDHQFPHHGCAKFSSSGGTGASGVEGRARAAPGPSAEGTTGVETEPATTAVSGGRSGTAPDPSTVDPGGADADGASVGTVAGRRSVSGGAPASVARDAARETRPDRAEPSPTPPGRGMPWEREGETPADWMARQSLLGFLLKVGGLSLVFTLAYYAGLAAVLYGWV